jgi:hypothetical protein
MLTLMLTETDKVADSGTDPCKLVDMEDGTDAVRDINLDADWNA